MFSSEIVQYSEVLAFWNACYEILKFIAEYLLRWSVAEKVEA